MTTFETKDSGKREEYATGSLRDTTEGKGSYVSLSPHALRRWALLMERGAKKYGFGNWMLGQPFSRLFDSALRHLFQARSGDKSEDHLAAVLFNVAAIIHFEEEIAAGRKPADLNDLPRLENRDSAQVGFHGVAEAPADPDVCKKFAQEMLKWGGVTGTATGPLGTITVHNAADDKHKADCEAFAQAMTQPAKTDRPELKPGKWLRRNGSITELRQSSGRADLYVASDSLLYDEHDWSGSAYCLWGPSQPDPRDLIRPAVLATIAHEFEASAPMTDSPLRNPTHFKMNDYCA